MMSKPESLRSFASRGFTVNAQTASCPQHAALDEKP